ncbi:MAG: four-carbon acid sugar kinase family protein, partial [Caldilineaceae bacterium]
MTILILADDLTGAADTASRCRAAGLPATIFLTPPRPPLPAGVIAFTSDSRHLPPSEAAQRVREVATPLVGTPALWYKKIDSTLRGNMGAELDALLELLDAPAGLVCPAFPAQGRGLVNGHLVAPGGPPVGVHLPSLLREQSRHPVLSFSLQAVRSGKLAAEFQRKEAKRRR